jgi:hypothetical protein
MLAGAPARPVPLGFTLCGFATFCFTCMVGLVLVALEIDSGSATPVAARGGLMLLMAVGMVATGLLADGRPGAYPAAVALAAGHTLAVLAAAWADAGMRTGLAVVYGVSLLLVVPILRYLRVETRRLWPAGGVPVAAARP